MASAEGIFVGCNKTVKVADYSSRKEIVAFGASHAISLWSPLSDSHRGVIETLKSHTDNVVTVKWFSDSQFLISASEDGTVKLWKESTPDSLRYSLVQTLNEHSGSITCLDTISEQVLAVGSADGKVSLWRFDGENFQLVKTFEVRAGYYPLAMELSHLEHSSYSLIIGGTNTLVYVYSFSYDGEHLEGISLSSVLAGHEDWIKAISVKKESDGSFLIATGSQDRYIRLWKLRLNTLIDDSDEDSTKLVLLSNKQHKFQIGSTRCSISFDAIIIGHDDWIQSLNWHEKKLQLLSSSADTSVMLWEPDSISGIWTSVARLGEISIKGASTATGSSGGFWSSLWFTQNDKECILTNGKTGSWRVWISESENNWVQRIGVSGPTREVTDLSWSPSGDYLLATSLDQTTRLFAEWMTKSDGTGRPETSWHEFARPQIHGYDMICVSPLSNSSFISGGDEKILRSFDEPKTVGMLLEKLCGLKDSEISGKAESASLPVLGLSNKAETDGTDAADEDDVKISPLEDLEGLEQPPFEDQLQRHTLWPEIEKLYGHGYEITTVDVSPDGKLIATACRSNTPQHAVIRLFEANTWQQLKPPLEAHALTITRLRFSPDNQYLLGVSRDRQFSLWKRSGVDGLELNLVKLQERAHTRIIWDCSWLPADVMQNAFVTAARDKTIKCWSVGTQGVEQKTSIKVTQPVTAIDCYHESLSNCCVLAAGLENGDIQIYKIEENYSINLVVELEKAITPGGRISRIAFSPKDHKEKIVFSAGGSDTSIRIYSIDKSLLIGRS